MKKGFFNKNDSHALIFSSFKSEMSKSRIVDKVTALMPLSHEEAYNLVNRTPIIVLDNMDKDEGEKLRSYFDTDGCELVLTEDNFIKRKCYRILWPEKPVLNGEKIKKAEEVLQEKIAPAPSASAEEVIVPTQTIPEIPTPASLFQKKETALEATAPVVSTREEKKVEKKTEEKRVEEKKDGEAWLVKVEKLEADKRQLRDLLGDLQTENEELKKKAKEFHTLQASNQDREATLRSENQSLKSELKEKTVEAAKPREKIAESEKLIAKLQKELAEEGVLSKDLTEAGRETARLEAEIKGLKVQLGERDKTVEKAEDSVLQAQKKLKNISLENETIYSQLKESEKRAGVLNASNDELRGLLTSKEEERAQLDALYQEALREQENILQDAGSLKARFDQLDKKSREFEKELSMTSSLEKDANQKLAKTRAELEMLTHEKTIVDEKFRISEERLLHNESQSGLLNEELTQVRDERDLCREEIARLNKIESELKPQLEKQAAEIREQIKERESLRKRAEDDRGAIQNLREELSQVISDKNNFVEELKAKTELLEVKEEEYFRTLEGLKAFQSKCGILEGEAASFRSQLEKSQEALLRVSEEKTRQKSEMDQEISEKSGLLTEQAEDLRTLHRQVSELEQSLREKQAEISRRAQEFEELKDYKDRYTATRDKYLEYKNTADTRINSLESELKARDVSLNEWQSKAQTREAELEGLSSRFASLEEKHRLLEKEERVNREYRERFATLEKESHLMREALQDELLQTKETLGEISRQFADLRQENSELSRLHTTLKKDHELLDSTSRQTLSERALRIDELERKSGALEAQLENVQRQVKEYQQQIAQQELIQKRIKIASDITEQESRLKLLVEKQSGIEREMNDRQETIKAILKEQEEAEKELIHNKQIQKHLAEQTKLKEKVKFGRKPSNFTIASPEQ